MHVYLFILYQKLLSRIIALLLGWRHQELGDRCEIYIFEMAIYFFPFMQIFFFPISPWILLYNLIIWVSRRVFHMKQELLTFRENLGSPMFSVWSVLCVFLVFCVVLVSFVIVQCLMTIVGCVSGFSIPDYSFEFL